MALTKPPSLFITGTTTNDNAPTGCIGEFISANPGANVTPAASNAGVNLTSISLTAGDWDVEASATLSPGGTFAGTRMIAAISPTSVTVDSFANGGAAAIVGAVNVTANHTFPTGVRRFSLSSTTTVYLVGVLTYSVLGGSVWTTDCFLRARRMR